MSKMNVVFVTVPFYGHLHPMIPLGAALKAHGHKVFVATTSNFLPAVADTGLPGLSLGPAEDPVRAGWSLNKPAIIEALVALAEDLQPDVIIHDHLAAGAGLAADLIGIPNAYMSVGIIRTPHSLNHVRGLCEPLWAHYGLPLPPSLGLYRHLYLDRCPPSLQPPEIRDIPTAHPISPLNYDGSLDGALPDWTARLGSKPVIYVTLGTLFNSMKSFADILSALKDEDAEIIMTIGRNLDPAELGPQPDNVHIERYIPQSLILPHCDLVISHGGSGTMLASLAQGLPLVLLPQSLNLTDQSWNGERCVARGVGLMLTPEHATPEAIRAAVRTVLADSAYQRNAQEVAAEIATLPGLDHAVELLENLVAAHKSSRQPEAALIFAERRSP
jgi:UDP:flavonoid glycosyltransferase YjiC (YdhE family)